MYSKSCKKFFILKFDVCASVHVREEPNKVQGHQNTVNSSKILINRSSAFRPALIYCCAVFRSTVRSRLLSRCSLLVRLKTAFRSSSLIKLLTHSLQVFNSPMLDLSFPSVNYILHPKNDANIIHTLDPQLTVIG